MEIIYSQRFFKDYKKLDVSVRKSAKSVEQIFRTNPFDPRLKTHKLNGKLKNHWAFSVDYQYRIIFRFLEPEKVYFNTIGKHDVYNRFLK